MSSSLYLRVVRLLLMTICIALPSAALAIGFKPTINQYIAFSPVGVAAADFNEDGFPDLAIANNQAITASIWMGTGTGFVHTGSYKLPALPSGVVAADFSGDGHSD